MALLPARNILDGTKVPATTTSDMKTALGSLRDFLAGLLGTDSTATLAARTSLGITAIVGDAGAVGTRNKLINGGAEVAQSPAVNLSTSAQYGQVDMCALWVSGGTVSAGTASWITNATVGRTGYAARAAGVTTAGSGVVSWRYRMEAADAVKLKNQTASFSMQVMQDTGANVSYTIIIRKPSASDNFTTTSVINTGTPIVVATATATPIASVGVALGDCSYGLEIEVQAACGAVTTKNFDFTEWQLEEGSTVTPLDRRSRAAEIDACRRYLQSVDGFVGLASATTSCVLTAQLSPPMRIAPSLTQSAVLAISDATTTFTQSGVSLSGGTSSATRINVNAANFTGLTAKQTYQAVSGTIFASAQL